jgi:hypothetical protein
MRKLWQNGFVPESGGGHNSDSSIRDASGSVLRLRVDAIKH